MDHCTQDSEKPGKNLRNSFTVQYIYFLSSTKKYVLPPLPPSPLPGISLDNEAES